MKPRDISAGALALAVLGFRVTKASPESVGMGVGFSLDVDAMFDDARKAVERSLGKTLTHCETGDEMRTCALEIARQRGSCFWAKTNRAQKTR